ncbi:tripartite tricarboxylate transporter TctB family protein [Roseicyclus sp.]|uniref:tripartite tricarboxylate transporter TctB family protein n=1 Tax=Roseicyclus sp. TaxID=1914329 RepID=UPI001BD143F0|nr:tripartite tricarboxylate transporter TctB family protein [Roseicyclus sp.]
MEKRPGLLPELIIPVGSIAFGIYYLSTVWELPFQAKVVGIYVAAAIAILSFILFIRFGREIWSGQKSWGIEGFFSDPVSEARRWSVLALTVGFIVLMPVLGFVVTIFAFVFSAVIVIGGVERIKAAAFTALGMTIVAFLVFIVLVKVRFPTNIIDQTLKGFFL